MGAGRAELSMYVHVDVLLRDVRYSPARSDPRHAPPGKRQRGDNRTVRPEKGIVEEGKVEADRY